VPNIGSRRQAGTQITEDDVTDLAGPTHNLRRLAADGLSFAASPLFVTMAAISANAPGSVICSPVSALLPIDSMVLMYLLMGLLHLPPWLKLLSNRLASRNHQTQGD
jgi:hypothetical protein